MDHLPRVQNPVSPLKPVQYYGQHGQRYSGPFASFGYQLFTLQNGGNCSMPSASDLAQKWLFFGLIQEFFAVFEIPFNRDDFLRKEDDTTYVTTRALQDYLIALLVQEHMKRQELGYETKGWRETDVDDLAIGRGFPMGGNLLHFENDRLWKVLERTHSLLTTTKIALQRFSQLDIDPGVWDSILVTMSALSRILDRFLRPLAANHQEIHYPIDLREFHLRSVADFRDSEDWCPNERRVLEQLTNGQPLEAAFFSLLGGHDGKEHTNCTIRGCVAHHVDGSYVTVHDAANCTLDACGMVEYSSPCADGIPAQATSTPEPQQPAERSASSFDVKGLATGLYQGVEHMIDEWTKEVEAMTFVDGHLQPVTIPLTKSRMSSSVGVSMKGWSLVAFSHVWSDGLGNREENALPACQLRRLQDLANGLYPPRAHPVPFWIDTLMIPVVRPNLSDAENQAARLLKKAALRNMEWVYKGASKVLVLDSTLFTIDTAGMSAEERGARIITSTWSRRLWTLQEGCMKVRTFFQFRDGAISWPALHEEVLQAASISDWRKKRSVLPKGHPIRKLQKLPLVQYNGSTKEGTTTKVDISSPMYQAKRNLDKLLFRSFNPIWTVVHSFLEEMSLDWSGGELRGEALRRCMRSMYYRDCTNKTDEGLVLASLLSAKPGAAANLLHRPSDPVDPNDRLRALFLELDIVPVDLLFVDHPRYQQEHCRWIPTSLLSVNAPSAPLLRRSERLHRHTTLVRRKINTVCRVTPKGLEIGHDGLRIHSRGTALKAPVCFRLEGEEEGVRFEVRLREPGTGQDIVSREAGDWVLIPETLFSSKPRQCKAILVEVTEWWPRRPGGAAEFSCLAVITRLDEEEAAASKALPLYDVRRFEKTKVSFKEVWRDAKGLGKSVLAEGVHGDDKWVIG